MKNQKKNQKKNQNKKKIPNHNLLAIHLNNNIINLKQNKHNKE